MDQKKELEQWGLAITDPSGPGDARMGTSEDAMSLTNQQGHELAHHQGQTRHTSSEAADQASRMPRTWDTAQKANDADS